MNTLNLMECLKIAMVLVLKMKEIPCPIALLVTVIPLEERDVKSQMYASPAKLTIVCKKNSKKIKEKRKYL